MKFKKTLFLMLFVLLSIQTTAAFSNSNVGNISSDIKSNYASNENLSGWINISLNSESSENLITLSGLGLGSKSYFIKDFLDGSLTKIVNYQCVPSSCENSYAPADAGSQTKSFILNTGESKIVGLKINANLVSEISSFILNLSSNSPESCTSQLKIDFLNDNSLDWVPSKAGTSFCNPAGNYGCYSGSSEQSIAITDGVSYCSNILVDSAASLMVGALVSGSGNAVFNFSVEDSYFCGTSISSGGSIGCNINLSISEPTNISVCFKKTSGSSSYSIGSESQAPVCGYAYSNSGSVDRDHAIFVKSYNYAQVANAYFNSSYVVSSISNYLSETYENQCSNGCYIPINITSNKDNQQITLNQISLAYNLGNINSSIYSLQSSPMLITMGFNKVNLDNLGYKVPNSTGRYNVSLTINNIELFKKEIEIVNLPVISSIYPTQVPAAINTDFKAIVSGPNITRYKWYFGDNTTLETSQPTITHKYSTKGNYNLILSVDNYLGESNKSFTIVVVSPKDYLSTALPSYGSKIEALNSQVNLLPTLIKSYMQTALNLTWLSDRITALKLEFNNSANDDEAYSSIAEQLNAIQIPNSINVTQTLRGSMFLVKTDSIHAADVKTLSGEDYSQNEDAIASSIYSWFIENLVVNFDSISYSAFYNNRTVPLATYVNFKIIPKTQLDKLYVIVNSDSVLFGSLITSNNLASGKGFEITNLNENQEKTFDMVLPGLVDTSNLPVYLFPDKERLSIIENLGQCNYNSVCEFERGENNENCPNDCRSWNTVIIGLVIVIVLFFILYIICQEWYKRRYESFLFKNKDDLYNIINFMDNAEKQGLDKKVIFSKLEEKGWAGEQLTFAYNKYKGKRTGMWEIPIFKFLENRKVNQEIDNRKNLSANNVPQPIIRFPNRFGANPQGQQNINQQKNPIK